MKPLIVLFLCAGTWLQLSNHSFLRADMTLHASLMAPFQNSISSVAPDPCRQCDINWDLRYWYLAAFVCTLLSIVSFPYSPVKEKKWWDWISVVLLIFAAIFLLVFLLFYSDADSLRRPHPLPEANRPAPPSSSFPAIEWYLALVGIVAVTISWAWLGILLLKKLEKYPYGPAIFSRIAVVALAIGMIFLF